MFINPELFADYSFRLYNTTKTHGWIVAEHYGVTGSVCSDRWDDTDAIVFCKSIGHSDGLAYYHALFGRYDEAGLPFFAGSFNCTGKERSLNECPFGDRSNLGNCSTLSRASAMCFNESGTVILIYIIKCVFISSLTDVFSESAMLTI